MLVLPTATEKSVTKEGPISYCLEASGSNEAVKE